MRFCYSLVIHIYSLVLDLASFFNLRAEKWTSGRKNWKDELQHKTAGFENICWIHCASAGEFEQAIPLIAAIKRTDNSKRIAVSFFSPSGFEMYKDSKLADLFFYLPLDMKQNAEKLAEILQPDFVIFIRNEIWWNLLTVLKSKNIPAYLVNANSAQKRNLFYKKYLDKTYPLFTEIFDTTTFGNTKTERVIENKNTIFSDDILEYFSKDSLVLIFGSSWQTEEKIAADFYKKNKEKIKNLKLIIAPHEFDTTKLKELETLFDKKLIPYSQYSSSDTSHSLLFLDKKGILKYAYRYADIAFIGGGFDKSVHNVSEAAVYGIPVLFGPNYRKFEEINELADIQTVFPVHDYIESETTLLQLVSDNDLRNTIRKKLDNYFSQQENVSEKIISEILK